MANITYRINSNPAIPGTSIVKGTPLTNLEVDANFKALDVQVDALGAQVDAINTGDQTFGGVKAFSSPPVVPNDSFSFAQLQNIPTATILGRSSADTGDVEPLTGEQARSLLGAGTPSSANFLRGDGQWSAVESVPAGSVDYFASRTPPTGYLAANGAAVNRATFAALFAAICPIIGNPTVTIANPSVFTLSGHGLINGNPVRLSTTSALPTGLNTTTTYFVVGADANTFRLSATVGGAAINTSGTQSGAHTVQFVPFGAGDGTTTFNLPDLRGEFIRGIDAGRGVDTGRTLGSAQGHQMQSHTHNLATLTGGNAMVSGYVVSSSGVNDAGTNNGSIQATGGTSNGSENRPRNIALLACIKF